MTPDLKRVLISSVAGQSNWLSFRPGIVDSLLDIKDTISLIYSVERLVLRTEKA